MVRYKLAACLFTILVMVANSASATSQKARLEECHQNTERTKRLDCYDEKTGYTAKTIKEPVLNFGAWQKRSETSQMTDEESLYFRLRSENEVYHEYNHQRGIGAATIIARCQENSTAFLVILDGKFLADNSGYGEIEYRVDEKPMRSRRFTESTDNKALGLWRGAGIPFLKEISGGQRLILRVTPFNESAQELEFDIRGVDQVVQEIRHLCNW